jgi:hypothetical protein
MKVVQIMKDGGVTANSAASIYDECNLVWNGFQEVSIEHCHREANEVAHLLARNAKETKQICIWDDEPPSFIFESLVNDVSILS